MRSRLLLVGVLLALLLPTTFTSGEETSFDDRFFLEWSYDFGDAYITTSPVFIDEKLFVRTSASWGGSAAPTVAAFTLDGALEWSITNPNSTHHDMSPIFHTRADSGDCGAWPDMLILGWSDGSIEARSTNNGELIWSHQTEQVVWGITGEIAKDGDHIVVPTRTGLVSLCAADGSLMMEAETGLGWRNGVSVAQDHYFLGDESGTLWAVARNGSTRSVDLGEGKIRHAPLLTSAGLLVQLQKVSSSTIHVLNPSNLETRQVLQIGPSPGIPISTTNFILVIDSNAIRTLQCTTTCSEVDREPFLSNGEIGEVHDGQYMLPYNGIEQGWGLVNITEKGLLNLETTTTGADGYATSGPGFFEDEGYRTLLAFGSDDGVVYVHSSTIVEEVQEVSESPLEFDWVAQGTVFLLYIALGGAGIQFLRGRGASVLKFLSVYALLIGLLVIDQVALQWSQTIEELAPESTEKPWDSSWDDSWEGTQIVSITIEGEMYSVGGLSGYSNAFELTQAACDELGIETEYELTGMGTYVLSFNGEIGEGWEYTVDGRLAMVASDVLPIDSASIVQWAPVEAR